MPAALQLILASTSRYRRELLGRLRLPFDVQAPSVDETPLPGETPLAAARRLSLAKAQAVAARHPQAWVIGSDQTASLDGVNLVGKPGDHPRALAQLRAASGRSMTFHTGLALVNQASGFARVVVVDIGVVFRTLSDADIDTYLQAERPYDCAGSAKVESLGIALMASVSCDDPTALVGLPLIALTGLLHEAGHAPLTVLAAAR